MFRNPVLRYVFLFVGAAALVLLGIYAYYGGYSTAEFEREHREGFYMVPVSVSAREPYEMAGHLLDSLMGDLQEAGIDSLSPVVSIYYPGPENEEGIFNYMTGFVISPEDTGEVSSPWEPVFVPSYSSLSSYWDFTGHLSLIIGLQKMHEGVEDYLSEGEREPVPTISILNYREEYLYYGLALGDDADIFYNLWDSVRRRGESQDDTSSTQKDSETPDIPSQE
ncbi:MAG: hypothetical protein ACQEQ4_10260 [Fibrobacterota bacterium]